MQALCLERVPCCLASSSRVRPQTRCQHSVVRSALTNQRVQAAGFWSHHSCRRPSSAVHSQSEGNKGGAVDRAMYMAQLALMDPEVLKFLSEDMPKDFANPEMMKEMMEDPDMKPMVEEHLRSLNNNLEKGMFDDITSRMTGQAAEKFQDFNFDKMYEDVGVSRGKLLDYVRDMSANPELAKVVTSPRVMAAIEEILQFENETQMEKYRDDFEVMAALDLVMDFMEDDEKEQEEEIL